MLNIDVAKQQKPLQDMLARRHPHYHDMYSHWEFCEHTYKGGREWFRKGNIFRYIKEGDQEYWDRVSRAYRINHTREVVDLIVKYLFKSDVARNWDDAPDYVQNFWKNSTLAGLDIKELMRIVATETSKFGRIWLFIDSTKKDTTLTIADEQVAGDRCYAYAVSPLDVLDLSYGEDGVLNWMLVREHIRDDSDPLLSSGVLKERFRLWTRDSWYLFDIKNADKPEPTGELAQPTSFNMMVPAEHAFQQLQLPGVTPYILNAEGQKIRVDLIGQGPVSIGEIPVIPIDHVIGDNKYTAPGLIDDIAYQDRAITNYLSNLDAIIQDQTFSQLVMPAQNVLPGDDKYQQIREMGTKRIFLFDGEGGGKPEYISPDPKQATLIMMVINKIINEIYHSTGLAGERSKEDNAVGIDNASGVAKAYDFERLNSLLVTKSEACENAELKIIRLLALWNGDKDSLDEVTGTLVEADTAMIKYADTFDVRSLYDEFTVAERLALIDAPKMVRQQQMECMIDKLFPALKEDLKADMIAQMEESWPITGINQVQITGVMSGNPSAKFPATLKSTDNPGMNPMPLPAPAATGAKPKKPKGSSGKNAGTQKRQGQVTSKTK